MADDGIDGTPAPPGIGFADQMVTVEEERTELDKIFERMLDPKNLAQNTDLTKAEAAKFARLAIIAEKYRWQTLKELLVQNLQHRVSVSRHGRKEAIRLATRYEDHEGEQSSSGWMNLFRGRGRNG